MTFLLEYSLFLTKVPAVPYCLLLSVIDKLLSGGASPFRD